jgi:hypothetical protein
MILGNTEKNKNVLKALLDDLKSGNIAKVKKALKSLQINGNVNVIKPLVDVLKSKLSSELEVEIVNFLGDLKDTSVKEELISILNDEGYSDVRYQLLTSIWNCKIDYSEFIADFVAIACDGNFMETFECLTILENLEGPFEERHILECQLHLKEYIESNSATDSQKAQVMSDIASLIKSFDIQVDEDY